MAVSVSLAAKTLLHISPGFNIGKLVICKSKYRLSDGPGFGFELRTDQVLLFVFCQRKNSVFYSNHFRSSDDVFEFGLHCGQGFISIDPIELLFCLGEE